MLHYAHAIVGAEDLEQVGTVAVWNCLREGRTDDDKHVFAQIRYAMLNAIKPFRWIPSSTYYRAKAKGLDLNTLRPDMLPLEAFDGPIGSVEEADGEPPSVRLKQFHKSYWSGRLGTGPKRTGIPSYVLDAICKALDAGMTRRDIGAALGLNPKALGKALGKIGRGSESGKRQAD